MKFLCTILVIILSHSLIAQDYTSYFTGNPTDKISSPKGGICLMGGAGENDQAMKWFLDRADHGDVLILRASGSDGYNNYMYSELGIEINSVESIVFNGPITSPDQYVVDRINRAEAIWFAGGDQWNYVDFWRGTDVKKVINRAITDRNVVIGGISAGMAIQGEFYFSAQNGTVTSETALSNPYDQNVTVESSSFIKNPMLANVITDTHFDDPDRKGRFVSFLARISTDYEVSARGIACDEYTAVCIDTFGIASVFGEYPDYDDNAYFVQTTCEFIDASPEICAAENPLTWDLDAKALKVYQVKGDATGMRTFELNDWKTGVGGTWLDWSVENGVFSENIGAPIDCQNSSATEKVNSFDVSIYPNPVYDIINIHMDNGHRRHYTIEVLNALGQVLVGKQNFGESLLRINLDNLDSGVFYVMIKLDNGGTRVEKIFRY